MLNKYDSDRPQNLLFEFFLPLLSGRPYFIKNTLTNEPKIIGFHHKIQVDLPEEYPLRVDKVKIKAISKIWHPHFNDLGEFLIILNSEVDKIGMHLFQQLLWDPTHIFFNENLYDIKFDIPPFKRVEMTTNSNIHSYLIKKLKENIIIN